MIIEERGVGGHRLEFKEGILSGVVNAKASLVLRACSTYTLHLPK